MAEEAFGFALSQSLSGLMNPAMLVRDVSAQKNDTGKIYNSVSRDKYRGHSEDLPRRP